MSDTVKVTLFDNLVECSSLRMTLALETSRAEDTYLDNIRNNCVAELSRILGIKLGQLFAFFLRANGTDHCKKMSVNRASRFCRITSPV